MAHKSRILGISCFFHDSAACLLENGEIVAAAQEERFTRVKHDRSFPLYATNYCLEEAGCGEEDIDTVVFYEKPGLLLDRIAAGLCAASPSQAEERFRSLAESWKEEKLDFPGVLSRHLKRFRGKIQFSEHHLSHAASAFFPSPFDEAAILTVDGVGEWASAALAHGNGNEIELLREMRFPHSLGLLYSAFTYFLGFKVNSGEYKLMGLAPYGEPVHADLLRDKVIGIRDDGSIHLNLDYFDFIGGDRMTSPAMGALFGRPSRDREARLTKDDCDIAASVQAVTEEVMGKMAAFAKKETGARTLCLAGGVALNCVANGVIHRSGLFDGIWVQPASGDAGGALGAALAGWHIYNGQPRTVAAATDAMKGAFLGPGFATDEIEDFLGMYGFPYEVLDPEDVPDRIASLVSEGKIVGVLQGRMEFGPRALGARSILGDPRSSETLARMNLKIKFRESFRPFAPAVLREDVGEWFELDADSPYMLMVAPVRQDKRVAYEDSGGDDLLARIKVPRSSIPAVTHVDLSARVQTVDGERNPFFHKTLQAFRDRTGIPVMVNTSFNLRGEPIVCSPMDAYRCMMRSEIDCIALENVLVWRDRQPPWLEGDRWMEELDD